MKKEPKETGHKTDSEFETFYNETCKLCASTSCIVRGGWRNPCFITIK